MTDRIVVAGLVSGSGAVGLRAGLVPWTGPGFGAWFYDRAPRTAVCEWAWALAVV